MTLDPALPAERTFWNTRCAAVEADRYCVRPKKHRGDHEWVASGPALPPEDRLQLVIDALHHEARLHGHDCRLHREGAVALLDALAGPPAVDLRQRLDAMAVGIECEHGYDGCPICDAGVGAAPPASAWLGHVYRGPAGTCIFDGDTGWPCGQPASIHGAAPPEPPAPDPRPFGEVLAAVRKGTGMTLRELASRAGADFTYLSKIENGHERPGRDLVVRLDKELFAEHALIEAFDTLPCLRCGLRVAPPRRAP